MASLPTKYKKPKNLTETDSQRDICDYLAKKGYFFFRNNNTPIFDVTRKVFRAMPKHCMRGISDIILIKQGGIVVFIEVKHPNGKGKLSDAQKEFKHLCESVKADYLVVKNLQEVIDLGF